MIPVEHIIFSRVEAAYSPSKRSGYQVVFASKSVSENDIASFEKLVKCFNYNKQIGLERYQFFWTPSQKAAIVKSTPVEGHREIIDRSGRSGAFIAHAILLTKEVFAHIHNDPFALIDCADAIFSASPERLKAYLRNTPPPTSIEVFPRRKLQAQAHLSLSQYGKLFNAGSNAMKLTQSSKSLYFEGADARKIQIRLSTILFLVDINSRIYCTFDTHVDTCEPQPGAFWAVGGTGTSKDGFIVVSSDASHLNIDTQNPSSSDNLFAKWFRQQVERSNSPSELLETVYSGQLAAAALDSGKTIDSEIDRTVFRDVWNANKPILDKCVRETFQAQLDSQIADLILPYALQRLPMKFLISAASTGELSDQILANLLFEWLSSQSSFSGSWKNVMKFGLKTKHPGLMLLASNKVHKKRAPITNFLNRVEDTRQSGLQKLYRNENAEEILRVLVPQVSASWLAEERTARLIARACDELALNKLNDGEFAKLIIAISDHGAVDALNEEFLERVKKMTDQKAKRKLNEAVSKKSNAPVRFRELLRRIVQE